jgi:hypothetical protein
MAKRSSTSALRTTTKPSPSAVRFRIVPKRRMWECAHAEAMHQFVARGIHHTEQHTGVLIFASLAEQYAEIVQARDLGQCGFDTNFSDQGPVFTHSIVWGPGETHPCRH